MAAGTGCSSSSESDAGTEANNPRDQDIEGTDLDALSPPDSARQFAAVLAREVCSDDFAGDVDTKDYRPELPGPHRILILDERGEAHALNAALPEDWRATEKDELEIVACIGRIQDYLGDETCEYVTGGQVTPVTYAAPVKLVEARTGESRRTSVSGGEVRCPSTYPGESRVNGPKPTVDDFLEEVVYPHVPVPDCVEAVPYYRCLTCFWSERHAELSGTTGCSDDFEPPLNMSPPRVVAIGTPVPLEFDPVLQLPFGGDLTIDWSQSMGVDRFDTLEGSEVVFTPDAAGSYEIFAAASRQETAEETIVLAEYSATVTVRPDPVVEDVDVPEVARVGPAFTVQAVVNGEAGGLRWALAQTPDGSQARVTGENNHTASVRLDLPGDYRISVVYDNGLAESEPWISDVITGYAAPVATIVGPSSYLATPGETVTLTGSAQETIPDQPLEYRWTVESQPSGASPTLTAHDSLTTGFVASEPGPYTLTFTVSDPLGDGSPATVRITVN